jgi:hypothetical protein
MASADPLQFAGPDSKNTFVLSKNKTQRYKFEFESTKIFVLFDT